MSTLSISEKAFCKLWHFDFTCSYLVPKFTVAPRSGRKPEAAPGSEFRCEQHRGDVGLSHWCRFQRTHCETWQLIFSDDGWWSTMVPFPAEIVVFLKVLAIHPQRLGKITLKWSLEIISPNWCHFIRKTCVWHQNSQDGFVEFGMGHYSARCWRSSVVMDLPMVGADHRATNDGTSNLHGVLWIWYLAVLLHIDFMTAIIKIDHLPTTFNFAFLGNKK